MKGALTIEQMKFLHAKGLDAAEMIAFAEMGAAKSKGAERIARWRARKAAQAAESVTESVTCNALPPPIDNHTPPVSSNDETTPPKKSKPSGPAKPEGVDDQVWSDFRAMRKAQKAPISDTVVAGYRREATKAGWSLNDAIAESVTRSWRGFKADWVADKPQAANTESHLDYLLRKRAQSP